MSVRNDEGVACLNIRCSMIARTIEGDNLICGHTHLNKFCIDDLTTWQRDLADLAGIAYGGLARDCIGRGDSLRVHIRSVDSLSVSFLVIINISQ